ncbi:MAG: hypothetical protein V2A54_04810 [Bacteroidota bacterium]
METNTVLIIILIAVPLIAFVLINFIIKARMRKRDSMDFESLTYKSTPPKAQSAYDSEPQETTSFFENENNPPFEMNLAIMREQLEKAGVTGERLEKLMQKIQDKQFDSVKTNTVVSKNSNDDFDDLFGNLEKDTTDVNRNSDNVSIKIENGVVQFDGDMSKLNEGQKQILMNLTGKEDVKELLEVLKKLKSPE